jgi:iron complex outermembrane receptor protein
MTKSRNHKLLLGTGALAAIIAASTPAFAQEAEPARTPAAEETAPGDDLIVVTGSRIRRSEFSAPAPITVITTERSTLAGLLDTAEILQSSTVATGQQINNSFSGFLTDGGPGTNTIDLRGLGPSKTLVLVNGRRFAPAGTSGTVNSVDLNTIPIAIVDRIEILKDGASSVYGADAVSGVVNIITRQDIDGGLWGFSASAPQLGDAETFDINAGWGQVLERGRFDIAMNYSHREEMVATDREWSECEFNIRLDPATGERTDIFAPTGQPFCNEVYSRPIGGGVLTAVGPYGWVRFDPTRVGLNADPDLFGLEGFTDDALPETRQSPLAPDPLFPNNLPGDFRSQDIAQVVTPLDSFSITSFGELEIDAFGGAELFYEAYFNRRQQEISSGYGQFFYTGPNGPDDDLDGVPDGFGMPFSNPLNPFSYFNIFDTSFGNSVPLAPAYALDPYLDLEVNLFNLTAGMRGDVFNQRFDYEIYGQFGRSDGRQRFESFLQTQTQRALDAVDDGSGNIVCRSFLEGTDLDCVPLDAYAERFIVNGELTPEERAYLVRRVGTETTYEQFGLTGYLTGEVLDLPAGALKSVLGVEYRNARINDAPDEEIATNNLLNFTTAGQTKGRDEIYEAFVEFEAPILRNSPFARSLTTNVSARYTNYDSFGDDTTYRVGVDWQVINSFKMRSTYGTSFRAPALYEQFLGDQIGFGSILGDPCLNYGTQPVDSPVYINCAAEGLPVDWGSSGGPGYEVVTGGADDITAETSEAFTLGAVWQPEFIDVNIAVDYYKIEVSNEIASLSDGTVLGACYSEIGFTSPLCDRVSPRDGLGFLTSVDASFVNISSQIREGVDLNIIYNHEFEWGTFQIDAEFGYLLEASAELLGSTSEFTNEWAFPERNGQIDFRADYRDMVFFYGIDWIGETSQVGSSPLATSRRILATDDYFEHAASIQYRAPDWTLTVGARNLFDEQPPLVSDGASGPSANQIYNTIPGAGYDLLGRSFFISMSGRF